MKATGLMLTLALLAAAPAGVLAADKEVGTIFDTRAGIERTNDCFSRQYTEAHMKSHPDQNVVAMTAYVVAPEDGGDYYSVNLSIRFRHFKQDFHVSGGCGKPEDGKKVLGCGIDCEGGSLALRVKNEDQVYIDIPDQVRLYDVEEDPSTPGHARFGSDDKVFRLDRTSLKDCLPVIYNDETKAAVEALKN